jgi:hypothetical protein
MLECWKDGRMEDWYDGVSSKVVVYWKLEIGNWNVGMLEGWNGCVCSRILEIGNWKLEIGA